jgi:hypothetical protein
MKARPPKPSSPFVVKKPTPPASYPRIYGMSQDVLKKAKRLEKSLFPSA